MYMRVNILKLGVLSTYQSTVFVRRADAYWFKMSLLMKHMPQTQRMLYSEMHLFQVSSNIKAKGIQMECFFAYIMA